MAQVQRPCWDNAPYWQCGHSSYCAEGEGCSAGNRDQDGFWGVGIQDLGIDGGGVGFDGDGGVGLEGDVDPGLDGDAETEEEEDEAAEEAAGVGANLANEFGINKEQLRNELHHTPVDDNTV